MFIAADVGCTCSPRKLSEGACPRRPTVAAATAAPGRPRCHPHPGRPLRAKVPGKGSSRGKQVANVGEGSAARRARVDYPRIDASTGSTGNNLSRMNTYAKCAANPCGMNTSKIIGLKVSYNEHLQINGGTEKLWLPSNHPCAKSMASRPSGSSPFQPLPRSCFALLHKSKVSPLCFHILTNCFCRNSLILIFMQHAGGCTPLFASNRLHLGFAKSKCVPSGVAVRLSGRTHCSPFPGLWDETVCYAFRRNDLSAALSAEAGAGCTCSPRKLPCGNSRVN